MNPADRVVEEHRVVAGPVLRIVLRFVGDMHIMRGQELAMKAVDFFPATGPQRDVVDADRLVAVRQLPSCTGRLNADVAVWVDVASEVVKRLVLMFSDEKLLYPSQPNSAS